MSQADQEHMQRRYEQLKRWYFSPLSNKQYDEDGQELPGTIPNKSQIVQMFETMGVELPTSPNDPLTIIRRGPRQE